LFLTSEAGHMKKYFTYILASHRNGSLYCGVAPNLVHRIWQHRAGMIPGSGMLVWYEEHLDLRSTLRREQQIQRASEAWKRRLIEDANPAWRDLYDDLLIPAPRPTAVAA
jgi:putative endonuclease